MPGLTVTYEQALRDLRDYFREMSRKAKRNVDECLARGDREHAYAVSLEADAYEHAMEMTDCYLGEKG